MAADFIVSGPHCGITRMPLRSEDSFWDRGSECTGWYKTRTLRLRAESSGWTWTKTIQGSLGIGFELGKAWLLGSERHLSISIGFGATRVLNGPIIPVLRLVNVGWAF